MPMKAKSDMQAGSEVKKEMKSILPSQPFAVIAYSLRRVYIKDFGVVQKRGVVSMVFCFSRYNLFISWQLLK